MQRPCMGTGEAPSTLEMPTLSGTDEDFHITPLQILTWHCDAEP